VICPEQERRLLTSLAEIGQQVPIVVVKDHEDAQFVVIDGYKRVRSLRRLARPGSRSALCLQGELCISNLLVERNLQSMIDSTLW